MRVNMHAFDQTFRDSIVRSVADAVERFDPENFNPDMCGFIADEVLVHLASMFLGVEMEIVPRTVIGNGLVDIDPQGASCAEEPPF